MGQSRCSLAGYDQYSSLISSVAGLGVGTAKYMEFIDEDTAIGTEIWNELDESWIEGEIVIVQPGYKWVTQWKTDKPYIVTKFLDDHGSLVGIYCDVARPVRRTMDGFEFEDLYLDVWQPADKEPVILDQEELNAAMKAGYVSRDEAEQAVSAAHKLVEKLKSGVDF